MTDDEQVRAAVARAVERTRAGGGRGLLLPALHAVQAELGCVPEAAIGALAGEFNLSRADVVGVVSFYRDFRRTPGGRVTVRVCRAEACQAVGGEELLAAVAERLAVAPGGVTADGEVGLDPVFCLGNCALGPAASVRGRTIGRATADRVLAAVQA
jgi:formate dehydrogenase subunit gamma